MPRFDENSAECLVFTNKEGLLSAIAHDLKIRVTHFSIDITVSPEPAIEARFDARSLRVVTAMENGTEAEALLSPGDKRKIEGNITDEVLHATRYPEVHFVSSQVGAEGRGRTVVGQLTLHGQTREVRCTATTEGDRLIAEMTLHQPDFGIKPYRAMLGTLRVKPQVRVRLTVPALP